jgi:hypothetical protein
MKSFTIENETNNIAVNATKLEAAAVPNTQSFSTAEELAGLAANWPGARLIEIWNSIPGNTPVAKFKDRATAVARIWKAIQPMLETYDLADRASAPVSEAIQVEEAEATADTPATEPAEEPAALEVEATADVAEAVHEDSQAEVPANELEASIGEQAPDVAPAEPTAAKKATRKKNAPAGEPKAKGTREGSKTETILGLMKEPGGTTLKAIMEATNWQAHSVRGFISGTLGKKMGLTVISTKAENGERTYTISA